MAAAPTAVRAQSPGGGVGACQPGLGVGLVEVPAGSKDPRAQNYVVDHVEPGTTFRRRFQVCNGTPAPITVQLYPGPAVIENGAFRVVEGREQNELTGWIDIDPDRVTVQPGQRAIATATFRVPADAESGERYGVLLAELPARAASPGQLAVASRVGLRVYLDVGRGNAPRSDFTIRSLQAVRGADGRPEVRAEIANTGARALDMTGQLDLGDGPGGLSAGPFAVELGRTLAAGDVVPVRIPLDAAIRGGPWNATLTARSGLVERRAEAVITFPEEAGDEAAPVEAEELALREDPSVVIPVAIGIFSLAVLLLLLSLLRSRARRRTAEAG